MCFGSKETGRKTTEIPEWVNESGQFMLGQARNLAEQPFEAYTGPRVAEFPGDTENAFQQLRNLISSAPNIGPEVLSGIRTAANAPAQNVGTERVVDEGGRLGALSDYTDPAMAAAGGPVQQAIRRITEQADAARNRRGAMATSSGAFGDARHGIMDAMGDRDTSLAIGETAGNLYSQAFRDAMGQRTGDLNRFLATDTTNAQLDETALERLMRGSGALEAGATADQERMLKQIQALLGAGGMQQGNAQLRLDRNFEEFLREYGHGFNVLNAFSGALKSTPHGKAEITEQPDNSGMQFLGSIIAAMM